jgi:iron complex outermembrane receptor protein
LNYSITRDLINETFEQATVANGGNGYASIIKNGNIGRRESAGLTVNANFPVTKWWTTMLYGNYAWTRYTGRLNGSGEYINVASGTLTFNANNQFNFGKGWSGELGGWYRSRGLEGQILIYPLAQISGGFGKTIFNGKGSVKFNVRDIFFTNKVEGKIEFQGTEAHFQQTRDSRNFTLAFTWRFGKPIKDAPKRRNSGAESEQNRVKGGQ